MPPPLIGILGGGTDIAHDNPWEGILAYHPSTNAPEELVT